MRMDREPHIGEYATKTNAIGGFPHMDSRPDQANFRVCSRDYPMRVCAIARDFSGPGRMRAISWGDFAAGKTE